MEIAIIDYGMGNLRSVQKAFERVGAQAVITNNADDLAKAEKIVLPGVGAIQAAMSKLNELNLVDVIIDNASKKPFLGICLGYQLLFETSAEGGSTKGLGIFKGSVDQFIPTNACKVPHMGWNQLKLNKSNECPLFKNIPDNSNVYFCHSYFVNPTEKNIVATSTDYINPFASSVWNKNIFGVQFHPEKSQTIGLNILKNFHEIKL